VKKLERLRLPRHTENLLLAQAKTKEQTEKHLKEYCKSLINARRDQRRREDIKKAREGTTTSDVNEASEKKDGDGFQILKERFGAVQVPEKVEEIEIM